MSTTTQNDTLTPLETHLLTVLALYEHGPIPESIPVYTGPASPQATEILRAIDTIARRTQPDIDTASPTVLTNVLHATDIPPLSLSEAEQELRLMKAQVQDVARVCNAITKGDMRQRMTMPAHGIVMVMVKDVVNKMADRLDSFATSTLRVAVETNNGALGSIALIELEGVWHQLSESVNNLSTVLTNEVRSVAQVATAISRGDLSLQIDLDTRGEMASMHARVNEMVVLLRALAADTVRICTEYAADGRVGGQMQVQTAQGVWAEMLKEQNTVTAYYSVLVRELIRVTTDLAKGKTTEKINAGAASGNLLELITAVNQLVDRLAASPPAA
ncbi:hypothetical protein FA95DRAFT_1557995 [Auriscalpium vulgare]|uniref:Uncharacterized protein n=1 Tax=Auriscalpium vulgare TaxID=40419 RepID=A0ACB8RW80_9AGAM|nr:hypothetical protein FA95DRAFT_1557995 [Auriscalpium vulgare]